jgi:hypothetical protein
MRRCSRCQQELPRESFSKSTGGRDGLHSYCKECMSAYTRATRPRTIHEARICPVCEQSFVPKDIRAIYCSRNCKQTARYRSLHPKIGRICQGCGKDIDHMRSDAKWCSLPCANRGPTRADVRRRHHLKSLYGFTPEEYEALLESQGGVCAICASAEVQGYGKRLAVDHCHDSSRVRGILCGNCNRGLGAFNHDPELLGAAASYLKGS